MKFKPGNIFKSLDDNSLYLILNKISDNELLCLSVISRIEVPVSADWQKKIKKDDTTEYYVQCNKPYVIEIDESLEILDIINRDSLKEICREYTKFSSLIYHSNLRQERSYIPAAGKVLDEKELLQMIDSSLDMWLTAGRFHDEFEKGIREFLNVKYSLAVNSGSSANLLAISSLTSPLLKERQLQPGDEIITIAAGFPTTVAPIIQNGLVPVFVDAKLGTYNIDTSQLEKTISKKTKAIFCAHTLGNPFDLEKLVEFCKKNNLWLIEDNCDALGSKNNDKFTGTFGHIGTLSFYPAHHITTGEGGAVVTDDKKLYRILLSMRDWGRDCRCPTGKDDTCGKRFKQQFGNLPFGYDHKYVYSHLGYNLKITDWQASIGIEQLKKLPGFIKKRQENFKLLYEGLKDLQDYFILPSSAKLSKPSWFGFLITVKSSADFKKIDIVSFLEENGIGTRQLFAGNILRQPCFINNTYKFRILDSEIINSSNITEEHYKMLPNTDTIMNNTFWIGLWPGLDSEEIQKIIDTFYKFCKLRNGGKKF